MPIPEDVTGQVFNRLTAIRQMPMRNKRNIWRFRCTCGKEVDCRLSHVKAGATTSCGCFLLEKMAHLCVTHGQARKGRLTVEYTTWCSMRARCYLQSHKHYKNYGGRGITVCPEWRFSFAAFYADMGPKPSPELTLERIDNDKGYYPGNCKWATRKEQVANSRRYHRLDSNVP